MLSTRQYDLFTGLHDFSKPEKRHCSSKSNGQCLPEAFLRYIYASFPAFFSSLRKYTRPNNMFNKGFHASLDMRTAIPRPFLAYYPAIVNQSDINETINFIDRPDKITTFKTGHPPSYEELNIRDSYDPPSPKIYTCGTKRMKMGDIVLGRSGDKGGNLNVGLFPKDHRHWPWLRSYMTKDRMRHLIGEDWHDSFFIERVEFAHINAVHFVIYGILGRGVSSSSRLDGFGKGFLDYIRDKHVDVPVEIF